MSPVGPKRPAGGRSSLPHDVTLFATVTKIGTFDDLRAAVSCFVAAMVTSDAVSRTGSFTDIRYEVECPNGPDCEPECRSATVSLE